MFCPAIDNPARRITIRKRIGILLMIGLVALGVREPLGANADGKRINILLRTNL
jgi:hypothetical protein